MKLESLKARVRRSDYAVDPDAVAEAILRRVVAVRQPRAEPCEGPSRARGACLDSPDVLEAG